MTAARLVPWKGIDHLIRVVQQVPDVRLLIAGDGPDADRLHALADGSGAAARVTFLGRVPRDRLALLFRAADYSVLYSGYEGLSHVLLESLLAGTPVIASAKGGNPEVVRHGENGLLVPYPDPDALAAALRGRLERGHAGAAGRTQRGRVGALHLERIGRRDGRRIGERMHVLMISLDASLLGAQHGNTVQRHLEYAGRIGALTIVTYTPVAGPRTMQQFADNFAVYPTHTRPILFPWAAYRLAARLHRQHRFDLVSTQDPFATGIVGLLLKWRYGLPLDVQNHSSFFNNAAWIAERPLRNRALHTLGRFVAHRADTLRVLTSDEKEQTVQLGIAPERVTVLSTPTNVDLFAPPVAPERLAALRSSLGIAPEAPVVLWVGLPVAFKRVDLLLEAYRQVRAARPDARLILAGNFAGRPDFVRRAQAENVVFPGRIDHDDLPAYYQMATVYAHSSIYEGFGKVIVEALAAGTPVVATHAAGPDESFATVKRGCWLITRRTRWQAPS